MVRIAIHNRNGRGRDGTDVRVIAATEQRVGGTSVPTRAGTGPALLYVSKVRLGTGKLMNAAAARVHMSMFSVNDGWIK